MGAGQSNLEAGETALDRPTGGVDDGAGVGWRPTSTVDKVNEIKQMLESMETQVEKPRTATDAYVVAGGAPAAVVSLDSRPPLDTVSGSSTQQRQFKMRSRDNSSGGRSGAKHELHVGAGGQETTTLPLSALPQKKLRSRDNSDSSVSSSHSTIFSWRPPAFFSVRSKESSTSAASSARLFPPSHRRGKRGHTDPKRVIEGLPPASVHAAINQPTMLRTVLKGRPEAAGATDPDGDRTPLHWAAARGYRRCVEVLLEAGADASALDADGHTAAQLALARGQPGMHDFLLYGPPKEDAKTLTTTKGGHVDSMSWHCALNDHKKLKQLLQCDTAKYADPDRRDGDGDRCPIHWAAVRGHHKCVELLLQHGANIGVVDANGMTAAALALAANQRAVHELLMSAINTPRRPPEPEPEPEETVPERADVSYFV